MSRHRSISQAFFSIIDRHRGVHLCGNPDWDFLLGLDLDVLSLDWRCHSMGDCAHQLFIRSELSA